MSGESNPVSTPYDEVFYPCRAYHKTHPDLLATQALLFGLESPDIRRCRVLEIGCGDGTNLIAMAHGLPGSNFVGIDLAARPLAEGLELIRRLELRNVSLLRSDVMDFPADSEPFDYIIAHGFYSWVPPAVRDRLLQVCRSLLSPRGVAFVSYNCLPGGHLNLMLREMMLFHVQNAPDAATRIGQARAFLQFLADAPVKADEFHELLRKEVNQIIRRSTSAFYHDDLGQVNRPVYFHEFMEHAGRYGLQYLAEAEFFMMQDSGLSEETKRALQELEGNRLLREQYLDFIRARRFRQTLLCRSENDLRSRADPAAIPHFRIASSAHRAEVESSSGVPAVYQDSSGGTMICSDPLSQGVMSLLIESWPRSLPFEELAGHVDSVIPLEFRSDKAGLLSELLLRVYGLGLVELRLHEPGFACEAGEKPISSPLARLQLERGDIVTNLRHAAVSIGDESTRQLTLLMDGTRSREELARALPDAGHQCLDRILAELCRLALLLPAEENLR